MPLLKGMAQEGEKREHKKLPLNAQTHVLALPLLFSDPTGFGRDTTRTCHLGRMQTSFAAIDQCDPVAFPVDPLYLAPSRDIPFAHCARQCISGCSVCPMDSGSAQQRGHFSIRNEVQCLACIRSMEGNIPYRIWRNARSTAWLLDCIYARSRN